MNPNGYTLDELQKALNALEQAIPGLKLSIEWFSDQGIDVSYEIEMGSRLICSPRPISVKIAPKTLADEIRGFLGNPIDPTFEPFVQKIENSAVSGTHAQ